ncbi:MAG TPA: DUF6152 family protein [Steroidobacteraceae bacterium]|nr:DUF6152 family protein [Steroidobacteraceae bacterium]
MAAIPYSRRAWASAIGLLLATGTAVAHHSFAMFDQSRQLPLSGTVMEFQWTNPHSFIELDVPKADGTSEVWHIELNSPNNLKRQGWRSSSLKPGDRVLVVINPLRDGQHGGLFLNATLPDGSVLGDPTRRGDGPINVPSTH